jgi:hypothetical protein
MRKGKNIYRRPWNELSRDERLGIVNAVPETQEATAVVKQLSEMFPEARWRSPRFNPFLYYVDNPEEFATSITLKPSEIAWKVLARLMGVGEASVRRWTKGKAKPRGRA